MLGKGLQFLVIVLSVCLLLGLGYVGGKVTTLYHISEASQELQSVDSERGLEIRNETEQLLEQNEDWFKTHKAYDADGNPTTEFLQYLESQRTAALKRSDSTSLDRKIAKWWQDLW